MADPSALSKQLQPEFAPSDKIEFISSHQPALRDGTYKLRLTHDLHAHSASESMTFQPSADKLPVLAVAGPRFRLDPALIHAVFPPASLASDFTANLPHVVLNRSTLPWERSATGKDGSEPWLALLLFRDGELAADAVKNISATDAIKLSTTSPIFPNLDDKDPANHSDQPVKVLDVPWSVLKQIVPQKSDLPYLAHVRQATNEAGAKLAEERAVLVGNRLPGAGAEDRPARNVVHLVSLENYYTAQEFGVSGVAPAETDKIRLTTLFSWEFQCTGKEKSFDDVMKKLQPSDGGTAGFSLPPKETTPLDTPAARFLGAGYVPLRHRFRRGGRSVSWYHGPLLPLEAPLPANALSLSEDPVRSADELLIYLQDQGLFDVSYAAAWELGRLLMLKNKRISVSLYQWKRRHAHSLRHAERLALQAHQLPLPQVAEESDWLPAEIENWFYEHLTLIEGVPFNYLVPNPQMLPPESIRFFQVDPLWIELLRDGGFSIGRVTPRDHAADAAHRRNHAAREDSADSQRRSNPFKPLAVSGFLLRSAAVSGWPSMVIDGFAGVPDKDKQHEPNVVPGKLQMLRKDKLGPDTLLVLFDSGGSDRRLRTVEFHLPPEILHYGFEEVSGEFKKNLRDAETGRMISLADSQAKSVTASISSEGRIDLADLATTMGKTLKVDNFNAASFAMEMVEGMPMARFTVS